MTVIKRWKIYPQQKETIKKLASHLNCSDIVAQLLLNRGVTSLKQAQWFLKGTSLNEQFCVKKLQSILDLIKKSIAQKKTIMIYGDYDVDGMTSVTMMVHCLVTIGAIVQYKIPHRFRDGYGLTHTVIDWLKNKNCGLVITLDCGITNVEEIHAIKKHIGCDVVIIDHHQIPDPAPDATIILNPKQDETPVTLQQLCTAGIVYKLIQFFQSTYSIIDRLNYVDLAALGTVADVALLQDENRIIVQEGLPVLSQRRNVGIKALLQVSQCGKSQLSVRDLGFIIAPRLNAAGRLSNAEYGVQLLLSNTFSEALKHAQRLEKLNQKRRQLDTEMVEHSIEIVEATAHYKDQSVLVLGGQDWHAGVIGIAASKLSDRYSKPVIMVGIESMIARGSARSCGNINIYALLKQCEHHFIKFGGHKQAAGFSLKPENFGQFQCELEQIVRKNVIKEQYVEMQVDMLLEPALITDELVDEIQVLEPFGHGNHNPLFYSSRGSIVESRVVSNGKHLKLRLKDNTSHGVYDAIGFNLGEKLSMVYKNENHFLFGLEFNEWRGEKNIQLMIKDIK